MVKGEVSREGAAARRSAGVLIIGNEILGAKVPEENGLFFIERFRSLGVRLRELSVIEDDPAAIADAVARLSSRYDIVCTSGGIGPTHDDVTIAGIARAFGLAVAESRTLIKAMEALLKREASAGYRRMARVPEGAELIFKGVTPWPTLRVRNVYIFPGVPWLLREKFQAIAERFSCDTPLLATSLTLRVREPEICEDLDALVARHPAVEIGSYPTYDGARWSVKLIIEGASASRVEAARDDLRSTFSPLITSERPVAPISSPAAAGSEPLG